MNGENKYRQLYSSLLYLGMPLLVLRIIIKARKSKELRRRWKEYFGIFAKPKLKKCIWVHSVSLGESIASKPLVLLLKKKIS